MKKFQLDFLQLLSVMILFQIGSAVVVSIGIDAEQNAWLAILIGMILGCCLFKFYGELFKKNGNPLLTELLDLGFGKRIGSLLSFLYGLYFLYISARVLRDFTELLRFSVLNDTPDTAIVIMFCLAVAYGILLGVEVLGRTAPLFFFFSFFLWLIFLLSVFSSQRFQLNELQPVIENGILPVMKEAIPSLVTFPFGEMIVFTMFTVYISKKVNFSKTGLLAILISGVILIITVSINIGVNGVHQTKEAIFPLLQTVSRIQLGSFVNRLDPIVIALLIVGGFFKVVIFQSAGIRAVASSLRFTHHKRLALPSLIMTAVAAHYMADTYSKHIKVGLEIVPYYIHLPFQLYIPVLLFLAIKIRRN